MTATTATMADTAAIAVLIVIRVPIVPAMRLVWSKVLTAWASPVDSRMFTALASSRTRRSLMSVSVASSAALAVVFWAAFAAMVSFVACSDLVIARVFDLFCSAAASFCAARAAVSARALDSNVPWIPVNFSWLTPSTPRSWDRISSVADWTARSTSDGNLATLKLVPYGVTDLGFGNGKPAPWRAGANENTVFTVSENVSIEGRPLPAGRYGLHMIAGPEEWTLIFSKDSNAWGSFYYDPAADALRVTVKPRKHENREWLTYEFTTRRPAESVAELEWEELAVPWTIKVENINDLYISPLRS